MKDLKDIRAVRDGRKIGAIVGLILAGTMLLAAQQGNFPATALPNGVAGTNGGTPLVITAASATIGLTVTGAPSGQVSAITATTPAGNAQPTISAVSGNAGTPGVQASAYGTSTNCSSSASPAVCGSAASGSVTLAAAATTEVVNTTAVTANSQILLTRDDSLGTKLSVTCNTATVVGTIRVSARTGGTSFTIAVDTTPATNPLCLSYTIVN